MVSIGECGHRLHYHWQKRLLSYEQSRAYKELAYMRDDNPLMIGTDYNPKALKSIFPYLNADRAGF